MIAVWSPLAAANLMTAARRELSEDALALACHAAVPAAIDPGFLHLLRVNFFLDPPSVLSYDTEAELLLSPLFRELGDGLYEIEPDLRNVLLIGLNTRYGSERVHQVALLLEMYTERTSVWRSRPELEHAQRLTALNILDEEVAERWLANAESQAGDSSALDSQWFVAVRSRLESLPSATTTVERSLSEAQEALSGTDPTRALAAVGRLGELAQLPGVDTGGVFEALRQAATSAFDLTQMSATSLLRRLVPPQGEGGITRNRVRRDTPRVLVVQEGDIVEGVVVRVDRDEVLLDIGYKTEGVIPSRELSIKHDVDPHDVVKTGEHIEALVLQKEDKEGRLILSKKRAQYERAWGTIERIKEEDGVVTGTVIEVVKGGLILDIGLRGFLPASLVEMRRVRDLQPYVGQEIEAKIIELDKNRNNVVLSRRAWLEQTQSEVRHTFLNTLSRGQIRKGVVSSIVNFGAFVDLGGVDGLVHVSELSWKHIDHPGEVVEVGQEVTVEVLDVDMDRERVSLSLKSTQEDPWQQFARTHQIGQVVPGRVTKLVPFGAFVRVEEGIEGLVHISELADRHVEIPEQVVQVGDEIFVKIIDIDLDRRRISLSLKQANEGTIGEAVGDDFDPTLYGMPASYDEQGNYEYPEGFDPETGEWLPGYEKQREEWEHQYAEARARFEAHRRQITEARRTAQDEAAEEVVDQGYLGAARRSGRSSGSSDSPTGGTLASDEELAALRDKFSGGQS